MNYKLYLSIFLAIASSISSLIYMVDTLKGKTKPNRVTFLIWGLPIVAAMASNSDGFSSASLIVYSAGIMPLLTFFCSFINKNAYWKLGLLDYICGFFALVALLFWFITKEPNITVTAALVADFLAAIPTIIKAHKHPETETRISFLIFSIAQALNLICIERWSFKDSAFQIYLLILNVVFTYLLYRKKKVSKKIV